MSEEIDWNAPARLDGCPIRPGHANWKRRAGYTETGTLAKMVERYLYFPWNIQQGCHLSWEATDKAEGGYANADGIGAFVLRVGFPPAMLAGRSRPPSQEEIARRFAKPGYRDGPPSDGPRHFNPDPHRKP